MLGGAFLELGSNAEKLGMARSSVFAQMVVKFRIIFKEYTE